VGDIKTELPVKGVPRTSFIADQTTIGLVASQLPSNTITRAIVVKASNDNSGTVYIGEDNTVTTLTGFELGAGESLKLEVSNSDLVWCIADAASQVVTWVIV
jgi:hypothetical protein